MLIPVPRTIPDFEMRSLGHFLRKGLRPRMGAVGLGPSKGPGILGLTTLGTTVRDTESQKGR